MSERSQYFSQSDSQLLDFKQVERAQPFHLSPQDFDSIEFG